MQRVLLVSGARVTSTSDQVLVLRANADRLRVRLELRRTSSHTVATVKDIQVMQTVIINSDGLDRQGAKFDPDLMVVINGKHRMVILVQLILNRHDRIGLYFARAVNSAVSGPELIVLQDNLNSDVGRLVNRVCLLVGLFLSFKVLRTMIMDIKGT